MTDRFKNLIPPELDLPSKYLEWRPEQSESVDDIVGSGKQFYLLDAPTGSGKTVTAVASYKRISVKDVVLDRLTGQEQLYRCIYLTKTKQLQEQILRDFPAVMVKGRRNYPCNARPNDFPDFNCEDCPGDASKKSNQGEVFRPLMDKAALACYGCQYKRAKGLAVKSPLVALNDAYFLSEVNGPGMFSGANMIVLDEIDSLEGGLMDFVKFTVSERQCLKYNLTTPNHLDSIQEWLGWANIARAKVSQVASRNAAQISMDLAHWTPLDMKLNKDVKAAGSFVHQMDMFINDVNDSWIVDIENTTKRGGWMVTFKPVTVANYAEKYLWRHGKRFLGMSGTILDPRIVAYDLGIPDFGYRNLTSTFPVENRLIKYRPAANLVYGQMPVELPKLAKEVASLIKKHDGVNILIHAVSWDIRRYLMEILPTLGINPAVLMTHETENRADQLELFKKSRGMIMISPSFDRGVDLPGDECRVVIICKMPYMSIKDKQVKARMALQFGQAWYNLKTIQTVMQMTGRAVRSPEDYALTYILDRQFDSLLARTRHLIPKWWLEAIRREAVGPL